MVHDNGAGASVVRHSAWFHLFLWTAFPIIGGAAGWVLTKVPGWVEKLPWAPHQDKIAVLGDSIGTTTTIVLIVLGVLAGGFVALLAYDDVVKVEVTRDAVMITRSDKTSSFTRGEINDVFTDGKNLVLLAPDSGELAREKTDHDSARLQSAFEAQGYPWRAGDPHEAEFARWVDGMPGLGDHANAVLRARQTALETDDSADAAELHTELVKLGIVVRDSNKRQHWRSISGPPS